MHTASSPSASNSRVCPSRSEGAHANFLGALDLVVDAGHGEAPFFHLLDAFAREDFGIDQNERLIARLADVDDDHALVHVDLRRSQADARRGVHGFEHVVDQLTQRVIDGFDRLRLGTKPRIGKFEDGELSHGRIENGSRGGVQSPGAGRRAQCATSVSTRQETRQKKRLSVPMTPCWLSGQPLQPSALSQCAALHSSRLEAGTYFIEWALGAERRTRCGLQPMA